MNELIISVWVRHDNKCAFKDKGIGFKGCKCRKHLYEHNTGKRYSAKTRSWAKAEEVAKAKMELFNSKPESRDNNTNSEAIKINEAIEKFLVGETAREHSKDHMEKYYLWMERMRVWCNNHSLVYLQELKLEHLQEFRLEWKVGGITANKARERYSSFFNYCIANDWITRNPIKALKPVKIKHTKIKFFTAIEYNQLLESVSLYGASNIHAYQYQLRARAMLKLLRWSGLRISDACKLSADSLNGDRLRLYTTKTGEPVSILLPPDVVSDLKSTRAYNSNPNYFFWSGDSDYETLCKDWWDKLARLCKLAELKDNDGKDKRLSLHMFRHTFAVEFLLSEGTLEDLQKLLGHSTIKTTSKHYEHWCKSRQDKLDERIKASWSKDVISIDSRRIA